MSSPLLSSPLAVRRPATAFSYLFRSLRSRCPTPYNAAAQRRTTPPAPSLSRERLNVLGNVVRKPLQQIFNEFSGGTKPVDEAGYVELVM
nr:2-oxoglutarate dehydrogenase, mitochondrial-like [Ipomoea trifida]